MLPALNSVLFDAIVDRIASGTTLTDACAEFGMSRSEFARAVKSDPHLYDRVNQAHENGAETIADSLVNIHETITNPLMARVVSENRRWLLARWLRERYGDKLSVEDRRGADLTDILREAISRIPRPVSDQHRTIDAQPVTIADIFGNDTADD